MIILSAAFIFGIVVLVLLIRSMRKFKYQIKGTAGEKVRAIIKLVLLVEDIAFVLLFAAVIVKTLIL